MWGRGGDGGTACYLETDKYNSLLFGHNNYNYSTFNVAYAKIEAEGSVAVVSGIWEVKEARSTRPSLCLQTYTPLFILKLMNDEQR